jgi:hypothetical protein
LGFELGRIVHIREGARFLGNPDSGRIDQAGRNGKESLSAEAPRRTLDF